MPIAWSNNSSAWTWRREFTRYYGPPRRELPLLQRSSRARAAWLKAVPRRARVGRVRTEDETLGHNSGGAGSEPARGWCAPLTSKRLRIAASSSTRAAKRASFVPVGARQADRNTRNPRTSPWPKPHSHSREQSGLGEWAPFSSSEAQFFNRTSMKFGLAKGRNSNPSTSLLTARTNCQPGV